MSKGQRDRLLRRRSSAFVWKLIIRSLGEQCQLDSALHELSAIKPKLERFESIVEFLEWGVLAFGIPLAIGVVGEMFGDTSPTWMSKWVKWSPQLVAIGVVGEVALGWAMALLSRIKLRPLREKEYRLR